MQDIGLVAGGGPADGRHARRRTARRSRRGIGSRDEQRRRSLWESIQAKVEPLLRPDQLAAFAEVIAQAERDDDWTRHPHAGLEVWLLHWQIRRLGEEMRRMGVRPSDWEIFGSAREHFESAPAVSDEAVADVIQRLLDIAAGPGASR